MEESRSRGTWRIAGALALAAVLLGLAAFLFRPSPPPPVNPPEGRRGAAPKNPDAPDDKPQILDPRDLGTFTRTGERGPKPDLKGVVLNPQKPGPGGWPEVAVPSTAIEILQALREFDRSGNGRAREALAASAAVLLTKDPSRLQDLIASIPGLAEADLKRAALILLGRVDRPEAVEALLDAARGPGDRDHRILAVRSMLENGRASSDEAYAALEFRPLVENAVVSERLLPLVELMRREQDPGVFQCLVESLSKHQDAAVSTGATPCPEVTAAAADLLRMEKDPARMRDLFLSFAYTRSPVARDAILEKLGTLTDRNLVALGVQALGYQTETPAVLDVKLWLAADSNEGVRKKALEALSNSPRSPEDGARIARQIGPGILGDSSPNVRLSGVTTLGGCGAAGRTFLERMASSDADPNVRNAARQWLDRPR